MIEPTSPASPGGIPRRFRRHEHLARQGEPTGRLFRIADGWACQYRLLPDGRRQIIALFLPGEYCQPQWLLSGRATWPVVALTDITACEIAFDAIHARPARDSDGVKTVFAAMLGLLDGHETAIINLGRMTATERLCNLLADVFDRLRAAHQVVANRCVMPLTQYDLADLLGMSPVHVNRVLQSLRGEGVIALEQRQLTVLDPAALRRLGGLERGARPAAEPALAG